MSGSESPKERPETRANPVNMDPATQPDAAHLSKRVYVLVGAVVLAIAVVMAFALAGDKQQVAQASEEMLEPAEQPPEIFGGQETTGVTEPAPTKSSDASVAAGSHSAIDAGAVAAGTAGANSTGARPDGGVREAEPTEEEKAALRAPLRISLDRLRVGGATSGEVRERATDSSRSDRLRQRLQMLKEHGLLPDKEHGADEGGSRPERAERENPYGDFDEQGRQWKLNTVTEPLGNPYVLQTGAVIPATLTVAVNSDLPGPIQALVSEDVYDSPSGQFLLIPQGARLFGAYGAGGAVGGERLLVAWQRIIFPDGSTRDIGAMAGVDGLGRAGLRGEVDTHFWALLRGAFLLSVVGVGVASAQSAGSGVGPSFEGQLGQQAAQQLGSVTTQLLARHMSRPPTLELQPGYRLSVVVSKDLEFEAWED